MGSVTGKGMPRSMLLSVTNAQSSGGWGKYAGARTPREAPCSEGKIEHACWFCHGVARNFRARLCAYSWQRPCTPSWPTRGTAGSHQSAAVGPLLRCDGHSSSVGHICSVLDGGRSGGHQGAHSQRQHGVDHELFGLWRRQVAPLGKALLRRAGKGRGWHVRRQCACKLQLPLC